MTEESMSEESMGEPAASPPLPPCPRCGVGVQPTWDWCQACGYDPNGLAPAGLAPHSPPPDQFAGPGPYPPYAAPGQFVQPGPPSGPGWPGPPAGGSRGPSSPHARPGRWSVGLIIAVVVAAPVAVALVCIAAVTLLGHPARSGSPSAAGGPARAMGVAEFDQRYLAAVAVANQANDQYTQQLQVAESTPCTCAPGSFDASSLMPLLPGLAAAYQSELADLQALQADAPPSAAPDFNSLVQDAGLRFRALQSVMAATSPVTRNAALSEFERDRTAAAGDAARLRADLALPPN